MVCIWLYLTKNVYPFLQHATHTIVFCQLHINGKNEGVHAFVAQIRDDDGNVLPNIHIADCGHKIGLNGVDNGRIWWVILFLVFCILIYVICCISHPIFHLYTRFQNIRVPRENLLNLVADVLPDGQYVSMIDDPDQVPLLPLNMLMWLMRFCSFFWTSSNVWFTEICSFPVAAYTWSSKHCS